MKIRFDDWIDRYDDHYKWACMCPSCKSKYRVPKRYLDEDGEGICSVKGCENEADYYIDFPENEVEAIDIGNGNEELEFEFEEENCER